MAAVTYRARVQDERPAILAIAWLVTLLVSLLPNILWTELSGAASPPWLFWAKISLLVALVVATGLGGVLRALRPYLVILLALYMIEWSAGWIGGTVLWQSRFAGSGFASEMLSVQLLRLMVALAMLSLLLAIFRRREHFFLVRGQIDAPAEPVRWLLDKRTPWTRFGAVLTICITLGTLLFLLLAGRPSIASFVRVLPLLPAILLFAGMNAWSEELNYRAALLAPLYAVVGRRQALLLTATFFGLGHFYGVPYGVIGVIMAGVLALLLGKSMLETRGFFWAWFIHFWQDVMIFSFMAVGAIVAGGG